MVSMFPAFMAVLLVAGAPIGLVVYTFAILANVSACLTHYGTTPAPIYYAQHYVPLKTWWSIGAVASVANLIIWTTVGFGWWKVLGIW
jgi:DASS family divalent anion:Na+ symporter